MNIQELKVLLHDYIDNATDETLLRKVKSFFEQYNTEKESGWKSFEDYDQYLINKASKEKKDI